MPLSSHWLLAQAPALGYVLCEPSQPPSSRFYTAREPPLEELTAVREHLRTESDRSFYESVLKGAPKAVATLGIGTASFIVAPAPCCKLIAYTLCMGAAGAGGLGTLVASAHVPRRLERRRLIHELLQELPQEPGEEPLDPALYRSLTHIVEDEQLHLHLQGYTVRENELRTLPLVTKARRFFRPQKDPAFRELRNKISQAYRRLQSEAFALATQGGSFQQNVYQSIGHAYEYPARLFDGKILARPPSNLIIREV